MSDECSDYDNINYNDPNVLKVELLSDKAKIPFRATTGAAGYDLHSIENLTLTPQTRKLIKTGIKIAISEGYYGRIAPRSSLAHKYGIDVFAGVIDSDYRGEVGIILYNSGDVEFNIGVGDRIAQLIITKIMTPGIELVKNLDNTIRNEGGFGSTGK